MNNLLEWLAKFFGHIPVNGVEALAIRGLQATLVLLGVYVMLRIFLKAIELRYQKSDHSNDAAIKSYKKVSRYVCWTLGIFIALHVAGIDLSALFTTSGLFAVALGFALKDIAGNYIGGLIIKASDSIKRDDVLEVDGQLVKVRSVGIRYTIVRTKDGLDILIPNALLVEGKIGNYTLKDSLCRVETEIGVSYSSDLKKVREVLEKSCRKIDGLSTQRPPSVILNDFGDSSVNYNIFVYIESPWDRRVIKSHLNEALWWGLKEAGIEIAFPQLDVHFDKSADVTSPSGK
jgi:small-conductance mechanosensitive channel